MYEDNWNRCYELLLNGDYDNGWPQHEWIRTGDPQFVEQFTSTPTFGKPVWRGAEEPVTLLVNADFGMGDTIQFWRFVKPVSQRVSKVILRCNEFFDNLFNDVCIVHHNEPLPDFDKIIHMMAIPEALGIKGSDIHGDAYIQPSPSSQLAGLIEPLFTHDKLNVGICWSGSPYNARDSVRSIPAELFDAFKIDGVRLFNLNKLQDAPEGVLELRFFMHDWNDTAHLIQNMDLVITVDTAVAHLAAAMGKKVWMLTPDVSLDWRWGTTGDTTVWYNSMTLFRRNGSWEEVISRASQSLVKLALLK